MMEQKIRAGPGHVEEVEGRMREDMDGEWDREAPNASGSWLWVVEPV